MGISTSRHESIHDGGLVQLTRTSQWRTAYRLLTDRCGLTHHEARSIFATHLGGLGFHKNLLYSELKKDKEHWREVAEAYALMVNNERVSVFIENLNKLVWEGEDPLCYTLVREICDLVRDWNRWGEDERLVIQESIRRVLAHERASGLEKWTERHLLTYLRVNGVCIEV